MRPFGRAQSRFAALLVASRGDRYAKRLVISRSLPFNAAIVSLFVTLVCGAARGALAAPMDPASIRFENGKLWLNVRDAPAADLLKAVAQKTGVRFVVDAEVNPGPISLALDGMPLERAIRNLVAAMPQAAGHTMAYAPTKQGGTRLVKVTLFGPGKTTAGARSAVYGDGEEPRTASAASPGALPTPNLDDRMDKMLAAGVPRETAEKVIRLTKEVQQLQQTPKPGAFKPEDLTADSREKLQPLVDRGVPMERAVQMLLLQERYQDTLKDLQTTPGAATSAPPELPRPAE
jgi:hypothetical protein